MNLFFNWLNTKTGFWVSVGVIAFSNAFLRAINLSFPAERVFDEVYWPNFAWQYLNGGTFYDVHPILATLPHAIGLIFFGDTSLGWRSAIWLGGVIFILGIAFLGFWLTDRRIVGVLAAFLASFESLIFVYGRIGLSDMFLLSALVWALAFFFLSCRLANRRWATAAVFVSGALLGAATSVKWYGVGGLGIVAVWFIIQHWRKRLGEKYLLPNAHWGSAAVALIAAPVIVYIFLFIPLLGISGYLRPAVDEKIFQTHCVFSETGETSDVTGPLPTTWLGRFSQWHCRVWNRHFYLTDSHPYHSKWWQWPFVQKPILLYSSHNVYPPRFIWATGNHVIWWAGALAVVGAGLALFRRFRSVDAWLIAGVLGFWLPWAFVSRILFIYHFLPALVFEILLLAVLLDRSLKKPALYPIITTYLFAVVTWFFIQYPLLTGL